MSIYAFNSANSSWRVQAALVFFIALSIGFLGLSSRSLKADEFFHMIAGQSFLKDGTLSIYDGEYRRGALYTATVGGFYWLFGSVHPLLARAPALLAMALLAASMFHWTSRHAGVRAAWIAALFVCFSPDILSIAQFARFYSMQLLLVWLAATLIFDALQHDRLDTWRIVAAMACLAIAMHLQVTTFVATGALAVFVLTDATARQNVRRILRHGWAKGAAALCLILLIAAAAILGPKVWQEFRHVSLWNVSNQNNEVFYLAEFWRKFPILFPLLPVAWLLGLARYPRMVVLCVVMFVLPLVVHSFGGMKEFRYLIYVMPFFFLSWAIAIDRVIDWLTALCLRVIVTAGHARAVSPDPNSRLLRNTAKAVAIGIALVFALTDNSVRTGLSLTSRQGLQAVRHPSHLLDVPPDFPFSQHRRIEAALGHYGGLIITSESTRSFYHLGPFDLELNRSRISDIDPPVELGVDFRSGHRVIGSGRSVRAIVRCHAAGTFLITEDRWRVPSAVPDDAADAVEAVAARSWPQVPGFRIYRWRHVPANDPACIRLRAMVRPPARIA